MESFRKFMFAALTAASLVTFAGCDPVEPVDDGGRGNGTALVDGKITGQIADAADIIQIKAFDYKEEWTMATAPVQNGSFTLALPETVESSRLSSFKNFPSTITVSDADVKQTHINLAESENLKAYNSDGKLLGYIECYSADKKTGIESFMYVDRDCKISGSVLSDSNDDGIGDRTITYNCDLKKGWNILYYKINDNGVEFTTAKPDAELKWIVNWLKQFNRRITGQIAVNEYEQNMYAAIGSIKAVNSIFSVGENGQKVYDVLVTGQFTLVDNIFTFTLELPETVESSHLYNIRGAGANDGIGIFGSVSGNDTCFSNIATKVCMPLLIVFDNMGKEIGELKYAWQNPNYPSDAITMSFIYSDRSCKILSGGSPLYNLTLDTGWNGVYSGNLPETIPFVSNTKPDIITMEWDLWLMPSSPKPGVTVEK